MIKNQIIKRVSDFANWIGMGRIIASSVGVLVVVSGGWWIMRSPPPPIEAGIAFAPSLVSTAVPTLNSVGDSPGVTIGVTPAVSASGSSPAKITVHVAGEVRFPGVVVITSSARVVDAVAAAGGATARADLDAVNLATPLVDAAQVYIPRRGETPRPFVIRPRPGLNPPTAATGMSGGSAASGGATGAAIIIDLNNATEQQLDTLPGVGPSTARAILAYRVQHGPFSRIEDLLNIRGIGPAKLDALRGLVRI
jgi:competence protein ComEA